MKQRKNIGKAMLTVGMCFAVMVGWMLWSAIPTLATETVVGAFTITTEGVSGTDYSYADGVLKISSDKTIKIKNTDSNVATTDRIEVADKVNANITLAGVNIDVSSGEYNYNNVAFKIAPNSTGNVTITLAEGTTNILKSGEPCAGLQKSGTGDGIGKLTINGFGTLQAIGGKYGAGIGGADKGAGSNITISGGIIIATGGYEGAGIGGGCEKAGSDITISGGTVTATGGYEGAGIGGGYNGAGSNITINGGTVTATGGGAGAGIGGGYKGAGSNITISGGTVTATGGYAGAGIGGGYGSAGSDITINGGTVISTGGQYGAGIGGADRGDGSNITINGGTVTATGGYEGAGIGGGYEGAGSNIIISGGFVKAVKGENANDIGGGINNPAVIPTDGNGNAVYLLLIDTTDADMVIIDGQESPTRHGDENKLYKYIAVGDAHIVEVDDTKTTYTANEDGSISSTSETTHGNAGPFKITTTDSVRKTDYIYDSNTGVLRILSVKKIGITNAQSGEIVHARIEVAENVDANVILSGVNINVSSHDDMAAFKIENDSTGTVTVELEGDNVLTSGKNCAGLQKNGSNGKLIITGSGCLTATGGYAGAGIGGGRGYDGSNITISGVTIIAKSNDEKVASGGAGIGGGYRGSGNGITINNAKVFAKGNLGGAGIGGGGYGSGNISINDSIVIAEGGTTGAGIGGGNNGSSEIIINDSIITAKCLNGAAIGTGVNGSADISNHITINNSIVKAYSVHKSNFNVKGQDIGNGANCKTTNNTIIINGGSIKGNDTNGSLNQLTITGTPINDSESQLYRLIIANPNNETIKIDGNEYPTMHHISHDSSFNPEIDTNIYVYLTPETHIVTVGETESMYLFDTNSKIFNLHTHELSTWLTDSTYHWKACTDNRCGQEFDKAEHIDSNSDGICDVCGLDNNVKFYGASVTLDGTIGLNFYMELSEKITNDETAYMLFTLPNNNTIQVKVSEAIQRTVNEKILYMFTCGVNAPEMADVVKAQIIATDYTGKEYEYSVVTYANGIIAENKQSAEVIALVKAMLNYGAAAQVQFGHNTENLANAALSDGDKTIGSLDGVDFESNKKVIEGSLDGINYYGTSTILQSNTVIRHYFTLEEGQDIKSFTFKVDRKTLKARKTTLSETDPTSYYYVDIIDIAAHELGTQQVLTITKENETENKTQTISFSVYTYINGIANGATYEENHKNVVRAAYWYSQATINYANSITNNESN